MPKTLAIGETIIGLIRVNGEDYFSITDIAKFRSDEPNDVIRNWMRSKDTLGYLSVWESLNNQEFDDLMAADVSADAGRNSFTMSPMKWVEITHAKGLVTRRGRNGGTYAHSDIAFQFASWLSPEFQLYIITEYKRLKALEAHRETPEWQLQRELSKLNYRIHTDSIKDNLIPESLSKVQARAVYADEADMLNVVVFGLTSREWKERNPGLDGNMRDHASYIQLLVLSNLETQNAAYVDQRMSQEQRIQKLREAAVRQIRSLENIDASRRLTVLQQSNSESNS